MHPNNNNLFQIIVWLVVFSGLAVGAWMTRSQWQPMLAGGVTESHDDHDHDHDHSPAPPAEELKTLELNKQARANLNLKSAPVKLQTYWRQIQIPGVVVDRPGITDHGVTSPLEGVVSRVHAHEGDVVRPGDKLFTLRLVSESLQQAQSGLYKAARETEIMRKEKDRIADLIQSGIVPGKRMIGLEQDVRRQAALIDAHQQELIARGLNDAQIDQIKQGTFLTSIDIFAPAVNHLNDNEDHSNDTDSFFEVQELTVHLGHQVEAGKPLAILANHKSLYIKGHAFKKEASKLARAAEKNWDVDVEFSEDNPEDWDSVEQHFQIRHLSNMTDAASRTFDFFISLSNQSIVYEKENQPFVVWRFRPGQRVRIAVPVDEMHDVIVVPAEAVYQTGPEAFVFQQNGDLFNRIEVKILHQDRTNIVIANDGSLSPGFYLAQNAAASLNRILKAQSTSGGPPPGFHVHADGTMHGAH